MKNINQKKIKRFLPVLILLLVFLPSNLQAQKNIPITGKIVDDKESRAEILNLGSGSSISISALANKVNKLTKSRSFINILPALEGDPIRSDGNYEKLIDEAANEISSFVEKANLENLS